MNRVLRRLVSRVFTLFAVSLFVMNAFAQNKSAASVDECQFWLTEADESVLFKKQTSLSEITDEPKDLQIIEVNELTNYQTIDGFGFTLTGGSARLIYSLDKKARKQLLTELFSSKENNIGINYLRISVGASDLSDSVFTYNDLEEGETDLQLKKFDLSPEEVYLIPVLKDILEINPEMLIMGSPWTAPVWMKTNNSAIGGSLKKEYFDVYAQYFVKYIQEMEVKGIPIDAITIQNEPLHPGNNPSMYMTAEDQAEFIKRSLGPAFEAAKIKTKIIIYDHNADRVDYPISILNDSAARKYVDGSAFHLYGGTIDELSKVHEAHPDKNIYFTEQWIGAPGNFSGDLNWHIENLIIGATRNWCKTVLEWNLAADQDQKPHTDQGGCTRCLGAITIDGQNIIRNPAYYIVAHASKFVEQGSVRIESNYINDLPNVAFKTPDNKLVVIVLNKDKSQQEFIIKVGEKSFKGMLNAGSVGTYIL